LWGTCEGGRIRAFVGALRARSGSGQEVGRESAPNLPREPSVQSTDAAEGPSGSGCAHLAPARAHTTVYPLGGRAPVHRQASVTSPARTSARPKHFP
jgi:hypothetical protein